MAVLLTVAIAQPTQHARVVVDTPSATPTPLLPPPWQRQPSNAVEYARYTRVEGDGTTSTVSAAECRCDMKTLARNLYGGYSARYPNATVSRNAAIICGHEGERFLALGVAEADPRIDNVEVLYFKIDTSLYMFSYTFRQAAPLSDAEHALTAFCPPTP